MLLEDAALYWATATSGQTFMENAHLAIFSQTERMPGYFIFLTTIISIFGENFLPSLVVQSVIDSVTCVMIGVLGWYIYSKHWEFSVCLPQFGQTFLFIAVYYWGILYLFFLCLVLTIIYQLFLHKPAIFAVVVDSRLGWQHWFGRQHNL